MDILDQSEDLYVILVNRGDLTKVFSNFTKKELPILRDWLIYGHMDEIIQDQIKAIEED